jgi:hypothetical protein
MILNENQLLDIPESDLRGVPVMWVQLDPQGQWLAGVRLRLPLNMWQLLFTHVSGCPECAARGEGTQDTQCQVANNTHLRQHLRDACRVTITSSVWLPVPHSSVLTAVY